MKANKFPGNVMKICGMKSWCQIGIIVGAMLILFSMILHGYSLPWHGSMSSEGWKFAWDTACAVVAIIATGAGILAAVIGSIFGVKYLWVWARDNCEQIDYEDE